MMADAELERMATRLVRAIRIPVRLDAALERLAAACLTTGESLDNFGIVVSIARDVEPTVPGYHMLRHRNDRIRKKWRKRLHPAIGEAFRRVTLARIRRGILSHGYSTSD